MASLSKWTWERAVMESSLSSTARLVALVINAHTNAAGEGAYPGVATIARKAGIRSRTTVAKALKDLEEGGFLVVTRRNNGVKRQTNSYELQIPDAQDPDVQNVNAHRLNLNRPATEPNRPASVTDQSKTIGPRPSAADRECSSSQPAGAYPADFEAVWAAYPKRKGPNNKRKAFKAWNARIRAGVPVDALYNATRDYAECMTATERVGTPYVMHAATFFGPDQHYLEDWSSDRPIRGGGEAAEKWNEVVAWVKANGRYSENKWPWAFDDPVTKAIHAIGGVGALRETRESELPFRAKEFARAYGGQS